MIGIIVSAIACSHAPPTVRPGPGPHHLVVLVFDALRPDFIDRFGLRHLQELRGQAESFDNAYLGYLGAETAVSHLVISAGRRPGELPWHDDIFRDEEGFLDPDAKGAFYNTGSLSIEQMIRLMGRLPVETYLPFELRRRFVDTSVYAVGEKTYAAVALGTPFASGIVTLGKGKRAKADGTEEIRCMPSGNHVPSYISGNPRFELECGERYGTEKTYYPLDGSRMVPGKDGRGGDVWVTDVALELMSHENWSGLLLTYGGIDKVVHMLGEAEPGPRPPQTREVRTEFDLEHTARVADEQLGRVMERLKKDGLWDDTLVVVTADHGAQTDRVYLGNGASSRWGVLRNDSTREVSATVKSFLGAGEVGFSLQDTAIRVWMRNGKSDRRPVWKAMSRIDGVTEIYERRSANAGTFRYARVYRSKTPQPERYRQWAEAHHLEIVDAMAAADSPDLVGLLADDTGFDLIGDHGGAQEKVQRIPVLIRVPGARPRRVLEPFRLYELKGRVEKLLGIIPRSAR
jgi:hypothetical protein